MADNDEQGTSYEEEHVHEVYEQIASHFSSTRYKVRIAPSLPRVPGVSDNRRRRAVPAAVSKLSLFSSTLPGPEVFRPRPRPGVRTGRTPAK